MNNKSLIVWEKLAFPWSADYSWCDVK